MKLAAFFLLGCWQLTAQTSLEIFTSGNFKGLKDLDGQTIIPPVYDDLGWTNGETVVVNQQIGFKEGGKWGLISLSNKKITQARFDKIEPFTSGKLRVAIKGKFTNRYFYGLIDQKGEIVLNLNYFDLQVEQGIILVTQYDNNQFLSGSLNLDLSEGIEVRYDEIEVFENLLIAKKVSNEIDVFTKSGRLLEENLHKVKKENDFLITSRNGRNGLISGAGEVIHAPVHKEIKSFGRITSFPTWEMRSDRDGFEISCDSLDNVGGDLWVFHTNGYSQFFSNSLTAPPGGFHLKQLTHGLAIVQSVTSGQWSVIDAKGSQLLKAEDSIHFNGKYFYVKNEIGWSIFDRSGDRFSSKIFDRVLPQNGRYQPVKKFNYWAVLDCIEKTLSDFRYDSIAQVIDSKFIAQYIGKWGVFHAGHGWLIPPQFDHINFSNGHFLATKGRSHHLLNGQGELLFKTIDKINAKEDYFILTYEGKFSVLNKFGRPVANTVYRSVSKWNDFYELNLEFVDLVTTSGQKVLRQSDQVQDIISFSEELFLIKKNNNFGFIDTQGNLRVANRYDSARVFSEGLAAVKLRGKWGFIDKSENIVIQPHYELVTSFENGLAVYKSNGYFGLMNNTGQEITAANYLSISSTNYGNYVMQSINGTYSIANSKGITILSGAYQQLKDLGNFGVIGTLSGKQGLLNYQGQTILNFEYDEMQIYEGYVLLKKKD